MIEVLAQRLRLLVKLFYKSMDVILFASAVETTLVERRIKR
jgi:hypothetical protein